MIDRFSKQQFEDALPDDYTSLGLQDGEFVYCLELAHARIMIRSSVGADGFAKDSGKDSIRLWLEVNKSDGDHFSIKKLDAYTTRVDGWENRMSDKIDTLTEVGMRFTKDATMCEDCGRGYIGISSSARNPGRPYVACRKHGYFDWLDEEPFVAPAKPEPSKAMSTENSTSIDDMFNMTDDIPELETIKIFQLSDEQQAIVNHDKTRPARVLATAGSGKTSTMQQYIARLVAEGAAPGSILYVTFNKSMADEGGEKIVNTLVQNGASHVDARTFGEWFCTIHAACFRMLKDNGLRAGVAKNWQIKKVLQETIIELWPFIDGEEIVTPQSLYNAIGNAKHHGLQPQQDAGFFEQMFGEEDGRLVSQARARFDATMRNDNLITFSDMMYLAEQELLSNDTFRQKWQNKFQYIVVDEGQDTNGQAMRILTTLAEPQDQFVVVGDADQTLYRFSGATPEVNLFGGFSDRFPDSELFMMSTNYRSKKSIVNVGDQLIRHNYSDFGGSIAMMFRKMIEPFNEDEQASVSFQMYDDIHDEAAQVAKDIKEKIDSGVKPGEIYVGARTRSQLGNLEPILTALNVPFVNITGSSFWTFKHISILLSYLRLANDTNDRDAFAKIYNVASDRMTVPWEWADNYGDPCSTRFLGKAFLGRVSSSYEEMKMSVIPPKWQQGVKDIEYLVEGIKVAIEEGEGVRGAIDVIIEHCMKDWLLREDDLSSEDDNRKLDDLYMIKEMAIPFATIAEFLDHIDRAIQAAEDAKNGKTDEYVVLSTYHRLKGLERDIVYALGWCEGQNTKTGLPVGLLPHTYALTPPPKRDRLDLSGQSSIEDERCIAFVACSRAKEELHLSGVRIYRNAEMWPSRFVREALGDKF